MKILFFCGSLEPGRDGVGDYTRRLAGACAARGHDCTLLALHDPFVERATNLTQENVRLIRLPAADPWAERLDRARQQLERHAPEWVSWQVVAHAFQPRGFLPGALLRAAPHLRGSRCHVMLHELWLGLETGAPWRARAIGWLQRRGVLCLLEQLEPDCVQTSNTTYQQALRTEGIDASVLGLFGNVPIAATDSGEKRQPGRWLSGSHPLVAVTFGTLHPQWQPADTVAWLRATAARLGRLPALVVVGRTGAHAARILDSFRQQHVHVRETGELDEAAVSHLLTAADFGLAAHPWALIGKSGAAAAMLDHGLPVLVPRDDWQLRGVTASAVAPEGLLTRLTGLDAVHTDRWLARRRAPESALPRITNEFLATLAAASSRT